jgi:hypothetical protein
MTQTPAEVVWVGLGHLAQAICDEIETGAPDLIVVLHCSGAVVWRGVTRWWAATRTTPLPPCVSARIGQATPNEYVKTYGGLYEWGIIDPHRAGHMLAWASRHPAWHAAMQVRIHAALDTTAPRSILVVDDVVHDGWTALTALGVLMGVAPEAHLSLMAGVPENWREVLGRTWIDAYHPGLAERMAAQWQEDKQELFPEKWWREPGFIWPQLVSGLTQGTEDALASRPLAECLPESAYLARYLPPTAWLVFSHWVAVTLDQRIDAWAPGAEPLPAPTSPAHPRPRKHMPKFEELVCARAWLQRWNTLEEYAAHAHASLAAVADLLAQWLDKGYFIRRTEGEVTQYAGRLEAGVLAYDPYTGAAETQVHRYLLDRRAVVTPFAVEYARAAPERAGAPVLVPVPAEHGIAVEGRLLHMELGPQDVLEALYEDTHAGETPYPTYAAALAAGVPALAVAVLHDFMDVEQVYYGAEPSDLAFVLEPGLSPDEAGRRLAEQAAASLTATTFAQDTDGITYLADAIAAGIITRLTPYYRDALLQLAGDAPDLRAARLRLAQRKGLV